MSRYFLNHIPKCAGTTIAENFKALFGFGSVCHVITEDPPPKIQPQHRLVYGHVTASYIESLPSDFRKFLIVRDPMQRVLSHYHFLLQIDDLAALGMEAARGLSLEEFVYSSDAKIRECVNNMQSRQILGESVLEQCIVGERDVEIELNNALEKYEIVGHHERIKETFDLISWKFNLPPINHGLAVNKTVRSYKTEKVDRTLEAIIENKNAIDRVLYRITKERMQNDLSAMMIDLLELNYFRNDNKNRQKKITINLGHGVPGSGWYEPEDDGGLFCWMGPKPGATVYVSAPCYAEQIIRVVVRFIHPDVTFDDISIKINNTPAQFTVHATPGVGHVIEARVPIHEFRPYTRLEISSEKTSSPSKEDGRELALAVASVEV